MFRWLWFLLGFVVVAAVLVAQWPATMTARWINRHTALSLSEADGTVWNGQAKGLEVAGLGRSSVRWKLSPWSVMRMRPRAEVALAGTDLQATGTLTRLGGGALALEQFRAKLPGEWLGHILADTGLRYGGTLEAIFDQVQFDRGGWLQRLEGAATWRQASVIGSIVVPLGVLSVTWRTPEAGRMIGQLGDEGGALEMTGRVVIENRQYRINVQLRPRGQQPELRNTLYSLARPDRDGWVSLRWQGPMLPLPTGTASGESI